MDSRGKQRCIAYVRAAWERNTWVPCIRRRQCGSLFCRRHEDAVNGAVLGLWVHGFPQKGGAADSKQAGPQRKTPSGGH